MNMLSHSGSKCGTLRVTTATVGLCILVAFVLFNVQPNTFSCSFFIDSYRDDYHHGWPFTYMVRDFNVAGADMGGVIYFPWPFFDNPPCRQFLPLWLVFDALIAAITTAIAAPRISAWLLGSNRWIRLATCTIIPSTVVAWLVIAFFGSSLWSMGGRGPLGDVVAKATIATAFLLPPVIISIAVCWAVFHLACRALMPRWLSASNIPIAMFNVSLLGWFLAYVVNDWHQLISPIDFLTMAGFVCVALLTVIAAAQHMKWVVALPRAEPRARIDYFVRPSTIYLATLILGWTAIYFAFISQTEYLYPDGGMTSFDAFGWPWIYLADCSDDPSFCGYVTQDGLTIGAVSYGPLAANAVVCMLMTAGTGLVIPRILQLRLKRIQFGIGSLFWFMFAVAVMLWLSETNRRHVLWPNWFAQYVLYFGIGCGAYAVGDLAGWLNASAAPLQGSKDLTAM